MHNQPRQVQEMKSIVAKKVKKGLDCESFGSKFDWHYGEETERI
ncbi:MAG: hypothetical protein ACE5IR_06320 [bacterium]